MVSKMTINTFCSKYCQFWHSFVQKSENIISIIKHTLVIKIAIIIIRLIIIITL